VSLPGYPNCTVCTLYIDTYNSGHWHYSGQQGYFAPNWHISASDFQTTPPAKKVITYSYTAPTVVTNILTIPASWATPGWKFLELAWDITIPKIRVLMNGATLSSTGTVTAQTPTASSQIIIFP
jgi:hypothetical protein